MSAIWGVAAGGEGGGVGGEAARRYREGEMESEGRAAWLTAMEKVRAEEAREMVTPSAVLGIPRALVRALWMEATLDTTEKVTALVCAP